MHPHNPSSCNRSVDRGETKRKKKIEKAKKKKKKNRKSIKKKEKKKRFHEKRRSGELFRFFNGVLPYSDNQTVQNTWQLAIQRAIARP